MSRRYEKWRALLRELPPPDLDFGLNRDLCATGADKTPPKELDLARLRMREWKNVDA